MKIHSSLPGLRLLAIVAALFLAALLPAAGQSFTAPGGVGFSIPAGNYGTLLGGTNYFPVSIQGTNDVFNDFDGDSSDDLYGYIGSVYDTLYEYEDLTTEDTYWTTNLDYGNYQYTYSDDSSYWADTYYGDYQYENPITSATWWTNTYSGEFGYQIWNGTGWENDWYDDPLGDGTYEYAIWDGTDYAYSWTNSNLGLYQYINVWTSDTYWTNTDSGTYQYAELSATGTTNGYYWTDTWNGFCQYDSGWSDTYNGMDEYAEYDPDGEFVEDDWYDSYPGDNYYYYLYEYDEDDDSYDIYEGLYGQDTSSGDYYYSDDGEYYLCIAYELEDKLDDVEITDFNGQQVAKETAEFNQEITGELIEEDNLYYDLAPWSIYGGYNNVGLSADDRAAETTVTLTDNAGNNNYEYGSMTFVPYTDTMTVPLSYGDPGEAGTDVKGTLTVEDTDPNLDDAYYDYCDPDYVYSARNAVGTASYTFYNPYTDMYVDTGGYEEQYLVESTPAQGTTFRIWRTDTYNARTVYYSISGTATNGVDYTATFTNSVSFAANGAEYVDIPVTTHNPNLTAPSYVTLTLEYASDFDTDPYEVDPDYYSATIEFLPAPSVNITLAGGVQTTNVVESQTPQTIPIQITATNLTVDTTVYYSISGTAVNGNTYSGPWSGSSGSVTFDNNGSIVLPVSTGANVPATESLTVSLTADTDWYQVGTPSSITINFQSNTNYPATTDTATPGSGSAQTLEPLTSSYNNVNVANQRNGSTGVIVTNVGAALPVPLVNVQAVSPYAVAGTPGVFTITSTGFTNALTVGYTISGTANSGVNYTALSGSVQIAANQTGTNLLVNVLTNNPVTSAQTVVLTLNSGSNYALGYNPQAVVTLLPNSSLSNSVASPSGRYWRGSGSDPTYWSQVIPLDSESGTTYSNQNGNASTLYPGLPSGAWSSQTLYHYNAASGLPQTNTANRIPFNNPIVAFGERTGGTPLYYSQPYGFGVYAGNPLLTATQIVIQVYNRSNDLLAGTISVVPPNYSSTNSMVSYGTNGFTVTTNAFGLSTTLSDTPGLNWGATSLGAYVLTHTASTVASNYYYLVEISGYPASGSNAMVINSGGAVTPSLLYTLEFEARPPWRSLFLDQPQFAGSPLPPYYAGMTLAEMLTNSPPVTNVVNFTPSAATNLDDSPELKRHPVLDSFVASMGNDPVALANYVINQIDLTDPMDYSDDGNIAEQAVNPGGISRGALGTFMEKQGSAMDQCALLVYLLRQAGVPAVYEFAPRGGLQLLDARLSQLLKMQLQGAVNEAGQLYTTNTMIAVNYPWVAAYIGTNWVHIFPWLKDYEITEGLNLWEEMPSNYPSAYPWVHDYIYGNTNLLAFATNGDNTPGVIFPAYLNQTLLQNHPGISVDDIGVQILHRQHYYARWQDFPTPTWVTNVSTPLESLTSSGITNISPTLTNIFDTVSVQIYSLTNPTNNIQTGPLRLVDLHNREFYIYQTTNAPGTVQLSLILLPFRTNITTQLAFTNDSTLLSREVLTMNLGATETQLGVRFQYLRHQALGAGYPIDPSQAFLGYEGSENISLERPLLKGDQAAICLDYGRVTQDMLNVYATDLWQMENAVQVNPALTNSISPDVYEGAVMYLAGMSYYKQVSDFNQVNENLHKVNVLSCWAAGLSKLGAARDGFGNLTNGLVIPVLPSVDMFYYETALAGNGTVQPNSGEPAQLAQQNYNLIAIANNSAEEHQIINNYYQETNAVSTVRLLQLSQSQGSGIVPLNYNNYASQGKTNYQGTALQSWDVGIWSAVANALQNSPYTIAYITPGPITNSAYAGMAALILGWNQWQALISPQNLNGATGTPLPVNSVSAGNTGNYNLTPGAPFQFTFTTPMPDTTITPTSGSSANYLADLSQIQNGTTVNTAYSANYYNQLANTYNVPNTGSAQNTAVLFELGGSSGTPGQVDAEQSEFGMFVSDPVGTITGEHYINETDLLLPGPLPLALRRNYSSQNLADNQFGTGWKLNILPYLTVTAGQTNIYAADMDGAVLAYVRTNASMNIWIPTLAANPLLANDSTAGVGGLANRLRNRIVQTVNGSTTNYLLYGSDGSTRLFQVASFNNGILNQTRPYLQTWTDARGNYYTFSYGTNSTQPGFGQVVRIQSSNGNYLGFDFDVNAHIIDAYSGDGRWLYYTYDNYGDLVSVTLPDDTTRNYTYQHASQTVTNGTVTYSTHLIIEEDKPDGRVLQNAYDSQRRVTNQLSTAGTTLVPIRTGTFVFSNNFALTNSYTAAINGYTLIIDGDGHTNRYDYTNSLITKITDPLGQTIQQTWYGTNATAPGYPRSLMQVVDQRGLTNQFQYDGNGNVTNKITLGDLTGNGIFTQSATNTMLFNSNSLPVKATDPAGNSQVIVYDPVFNFQPQQVIFYAGASAVSTNFTYYGNATNVVVDGSITQTNTALGLPVRQIRAFGSPDAATNDLQYNGNGFLTETIRYSGTRDPNVTTTFFYNERGMMVNRVDALGAVTFFDYDALNRPIEQENFDEFGNALSWNFNYYDDNGELNWTEGPRYNPENYVYYDHDGAGRMTTEIDWRSQANTTGTGVTTPAGYNLYAQTFFQYDPIGNLLLTVDPRGAMTTNTYDVLSRVVQRTHLDTNGTTVLSVENYGYEPGGLVRYYTNALGGVATNLYTSAGRPESRRNADGSTNAWRYYLDGRIYREIQGNGAYWQTAYDDFNRITTRTFYSAAGVAEATNSVQLDRRGNPILRVDEGGNWFTTAFDGLDRTKVAAGPAIVTVNSYLSQIGGPVYYVTNTLQEAVTNFYDAAGRVVTNVNALGESTISTMDAIGRTTAVKIYGSSGSLVRGKYFTYSPDHNSVTVTDGSGSTAVSHTTWTDTDGHTVLAIASPASGVSEFTLNQYDLAGNLVSAQHDSSAGGTITNWTTTTFAYDGLNRLVQRTDRDNALTSYAYDGLNDVTNRILPGTNLTWIASYNTAGQMLQERIVSGSSGTRTNTYAYFASGTPFTGLLQSRTDGRGVVCTNFYDDRLRVTTNAYTGSLPEQKLTTVWQYDARNNVTGISEQFATTNTGPATSIQRSFDPYGLLATESVNGGAASYGLNQGWDAAGRRAQLNFGANNTYGFVWQADGNLITASDSTGNGAYTYDTAGILTSRQIGNRQTSIASRDGEGRPLTIATTLNFYQSLLNETLAWSGDGLLLSDTLNRSDFTDTRSYTYANLSRRVTQEQFNLNTSATWTNNFGYDNGVPAGPGVLTSAGQSGAGAASWSAVSGSFARVSVSTNTINTYDAFGHANGQSTLYGWLDSEPITITGIGSSNMEWRAEMDLSSGTHQLKVAALHPSGFYTAWATNSFTNSLAYQPATDTYDGAGNITNRVWKNPGGSVERSQALSWDARGRLHAVTERDNHTNGYNWTAEYDALNRRISTTSVLVTNGVAWTNFPTTINSYFDPQVEFLELGVSYGSTTEWKLYGPDLNGVYGGANGTGGFDAVSPYLNWFEPTVSDFRGNILGVVTNGVMEWNPARPTGYGSVPGYRPPALGNGASIALSSAWRGRWVDITGLYNIGLRPYDPVSGRWLTYDSVWNSGDPNYLTFSGGDPINGFDPDGRCVESTIELGVGTIQKVVGGIGQLGAIGYDMVAQTTWAAAGSGGEYQGVSDLYQNIYQNPNAGPTFGSIAEGTIETEANIGTLGIYGMAQGFYTGATTGDYSQAQSASLNALMMAPGASQLSDALGGVTSATENTLPTLTSSTPAPTITLPSGLMDEAAQLQTQWPSQMQALQDSGQPLNMASSSAADTGAGSSMLQDYLSGSGGRWGGSATRALNSDLATQLENQGFTITGGAGRASEEWIPGPGGGTTGGTFVDITASDGTSTIRIQTVSTYANGAPTASEAAAANRIQAAFPSDHLILIPKTPQ